MTNTPHIVYNDDIMITMRGVSDSVGLPYTVNPFEIADREALLELREGPAGPQGPDGAPGWPWEWQGDVPDPAALQALKLTTSDARKAWRVVSENAVYYWTGLEFIAFTKAFGKTGRSGPVNRLTGAAAAGPTGSAASAKLTGTAPQQQLHITFPRGETGEIGDPGKKGRIQDSADVLIDDDHLLGQDYVLGWNPTLGKFVPAPGPRLGGPWAIAQNQFASGRQLDESVKVLAAITIPGQPVSWRPRIDGKIDVLTHTSGGTLCDVEVRLGGPDGDLIGYGHGYPDDRFGEILLSSKFQPAMTPESNFGVVPANQTTTLYVILKRVRGAERYTITNFGAQMIVYAQPVAR
ncbi:hypothetical protein [Nocardia crassostreae]|uniref:hypothetical protein n=1 Tax=Nocardia crassostreae TaxID=53428 RepID=UPI0008297620|nr:hypothetical protein [Nocardia crassostreae]